MSPLVVRDVAQALDEAALVASEPITVILSAKGWVRAAKGHDVDAPALSYREGDAFQSAARGKTTQQVAFIDSSGRSYSTPAHTLPSARGNGEPLTGRFTPAPGARFDAVAIADASSKLVLATDHGYGFVTKFEALLANKKAGKQLINIDDNAHVLVPAAVADSARDRIVVATSSGHLFIFSVAELPELDNGGKGNKLIEIPKARLAAGERVAGITVVAEGSGEVTLYAGARKLILKWADLVEYGGSRAQRGSSLPRGFQRVERLETSG
jgi:topoisomerase-4 subunit A